MKKFLSLKYLTTVCFLLILGAMLVGLIRPTYYAIYTQLQNIRSGQGVSVQNFEYAVNDSLPRKQAYITLNGGFQRLMGLRHVNERYRLDNGQLTYVIPKTDVTGMAENTIAFRDALAEMEIPYCYVNTLFKIDPNDKQLPPSVEDWSGENTDRFLALLEENDVMTLDLRRLEKEQGLDHYSMYFRTDHHWTPEAGFWAYTQIAAWLEKQDNNFAVNPIITNGDNYVHTVYEEVFCGSAARRVGPLYAGLDNLTVITPKFETHLSSFVPAYANFREGNYEDTLLYYEHLSKDNLLETSAYGTYLGEDQPEMILTNHSRSQNLAVQSTPKKLLILKDSSALVVAPYLVLSYDEIRLIDLRSFQGDLMAYIQEYQPDMVLTIYNPGALEVHNANMFEFVK